jgi:O-antigen/teichoic acid export membrane protein
VAGVACARYLGRSQYGQLGVILSTANLFTTLGAAGLGVTATKHVAELRRSDPERAGRIIGMTRATAIVAGLAFSAAFLVLSGWLSRTVLRAPELTGLLRVSAGILFFTSLNAYQAGALAGFEAFKPLAAANLIRGASVPLLVIGAAYWGLPGAVLANIAVAITSCVANEAMLRRECARHHIRIDIRPTFEELRILYRFSLPVLLATVSSTPAIWLSTAAVARTSGFAEVGIFNAAMQWQSAILFLTSAVSAIGLPMLSGVVAERNLPRFKRVMGLSFALTTGSALLAAIPICLAAPWIMRAYGHGFAAGSKVLIVVAASTVLTAMSITVGHAIWSLNAPVAGVVFALLRGCLLVSSAFALAKFGALGLAEANLITMVIQTVAVIPYMGHLIRKQAWVCSNTPVPLSS